MVLCIEMLKKDEKGALVLIMTLYALTRTTLTAFALVSRAALFPVHGHQYLWEYTKSEWINVWGMWDSAWYVDIIRNGYTGVPKESAGFVDYAFSPLYPFLSKTLVFAVGEFGAALVISNISFIASSYLVYLISRDYAGEAYAKRVLVALMVFPTSFLFSAALSESLFFLISLAIVFAVQKGKVWATAMLGFLAPLARPFGVVALLPILSEAIKKRRVRDAVPLVFPVLGLFAWIGWVYQLTGRWTATWEAQAAWGRHLSNPVTLVRNVFFAHDTFTFVAGVLFFFMFAIVLTSRGRAPRSVWILSVAIVSTPLFFSPHPDLVPALPRIAASAPAIYMGIGGLLKKDYLVYLASPFGFALQIALFSLWTNGYLLIV